MELIHEGIPLYRQLAKILWKGIEHGEYKGKLPPEHILTEEFKVSRSTVRQALEVLKREGLAYAQRGVGTLLSRPDVFKYGMITGDLQDLLYLSTESTVKIIRKEVIPAGEEVAEKLKLAPGERVFRYSTLRSIRKRPFAFSQIHIPHSLGFQIGSEQLKVKPVFRLIEEYHHLHISEILTHFTAVLADQDLTRVLQVKKGEPVLRLHRTYHVANGRPVELSIISYDVKGVDYTIKLHRHSKPTIAPKS